MVAPQPAILATAVERDPNPFFYYSVSGATGRAIFAAPFDGSGSTNASSATRPGRTWFIPYYMFRLLPPDPLYAWYTPYPVLAAAEDPDEFFAVPISGSFPGLRWDQVQDTVLEVMDDKIYMIHPVVHHNSQPAYIDIPFPNEDGEEQVVCTRNWNGWNYSDKERFAFYAELILQVCEKMRDFRTATGKLVHAIHITLTPDPDRLDGLDGGILLATRALARLLSSDRDRLDSLGLDWLLGGIAGGPDMYTTPNVMASGKKVVARDGDFHHHAVLFIIHKGGPSFRADHGESVMAEMQPKIQNFLRILCKMGFGIEKFEEVNDPTKSHGLNWINYVGPDELIPSTLMRIVGYDCIGKAGVKAHKWRKESDYAQYVMNKVEMQSEYSMCMHEVRRMTGRIMNICFPDRPPAAAAAAPAAAAGAASDSSGSE